MNKKKKKGFLDRMFRFSAKPTRVLIEEIVKGIKEGSKDPEKDHEKKDQ